MIVVETRLDGSFLPIARDREMLRLGDLVAMNGELGIEARDRAFEVLRRFKTISETQQADQIVAVGTSAMREASDGPEFVETVQRKLGITIQIIDGIREATTIFAAIKASIVLDPAPALALDLGGGSLEIMLGDTTGLDYAASAKLGVGRLTTKFLLSDPPTKSEIAEAKSYIAQELDSILVELVEYKPRLLIGSSGTFIAIATIAATLRDGKAPEHVNHLTVSYEDIVAASKRVFEENRSSRTKIPGADARRAELLPAGFLVLLYVMEHMDFNELTVSGWALREGLILRAIEEHDPSDLSDDPRGIRRNSVLSLCHRCNWNAQHGFQVAELATSLFDATQLLHKMTDKERDLLELGALMHDIGEHISRTNHDRHSAYLIEHGDLRGFTSEEIKTLALLARFHLRGSVKALKKDPLISQAQHESLKKMIGILRIADALDASHGDEISALSTSLGPDKHLVLSLVAKDEAELELWALRRKQDFFEQVFQVTVEPQFQGSRRNKVASSFAGGSGLG
jgi:exopolyphosphatase/guanosine-5'-triphosphate,3'-diphosphate pyrophosphatase